MKAKVLMTLLLSAAALPTLANDAFESMFVGTVTHIAQVSPEERRMMRERWHEASPEQRMQMRRRFQERMQQVSPEERDARVRQWQNSIPNPAGCVDCMDTMSNFGAGFERRQPRQAESNVPPANPPVFNSFNPFAGGRR